MDKLLLTDTIKQLLKLPEVQTDHGVFRLHYKLTATLLLACSILVSATQFFGDPIHCVTHDAIIATKVMNNYCWIESTFTLRRSLNGTLGDEVAAPGVDQRRIGRDEPVIEHTYYQWVSLFLFLQAGAFYLPRWIWRNWEQGRMKNLVNELSKPALQCDAKAECIKTFVQYFLAHSAENQAYAVHFFICELLTLANVVLQLYLLDRFLGFQFWNYGPAAIAFLGEDPGVRVDPMTSVFPKMSKCRLRRFGTSGEVQVHDAICLLALNVLNEKIFVFLWFWLVFLTICTVGSLVYRGFIMKAPSYRYRLLSTVARMARKEDLENFADNAQYGDWFMLSLLKDNVKAHYFKDVVHKLSSEITAQRQKPRG